MDDGSTLGLSQDTYLYGKEDLYKKVKGSRYMITARGLATSKEKYNDIYVRSQETFLQLDHGCAPVCRSCSTTLTGNRSRWPGWVP